MGPDGRPDLRCGGGRPEAARPRLTPCRHAPSPARPGPGSRPRLRLLATALTVAAALALTGCRDGEGLRDEGPSGSSTLKGSGLLPGTGAYGVEVAPARFQAKPPSGNS